MSVHKYALDEDVRTSLDDAQKLQFDLTENNGNVSKASGGVTQTAKDRREFRYQSFKKHMAELNHALRVGLLLSTAGGLILWKCLQSLLALSKTDRQILATGGILFAMLLFVFAAYKLTDGTIERDVAEEYFESIVNSDKIHDRDYKQVKKRFQQNNAYNSGQAIQTPNYEPRNARSEAKLLGHFEYTDSSVRSIFIAFCLFLFAMFVLLNSAIQFDTFRGKVMRTKRTAAE